MIGSRSRSTVAAAVLVLATSCQDAAIPTTPFRQVTTRASIVGLETFYGPEAFQRGTGAPTTIVRDLSTDGFEAAFVIHVRNGEGDGTRRASSARIMLDGETLFGPSDYDQQEGGERVVTVSPGATTRLSVEVAGKPGSVIYIHMEGKRAATPYCPSGRKTSRPRTSKPSKSP